jgi:uncharacterized protein (DUF1501 family)
MTIKASRREFLKRASALSFAGPVAPLALNMAALSEASASVATDYKAIVCVFMAGGNDYANTVVPYDLESHQKYKILRPALGFNREALEGTLLSPEKGFQLSGGRQYALAPNLKPLTDLFDRKKLAVLLNIGTLIGPTSKLDYTNRSVELPPKLFSHNDQQSFWQSCQAEGAPYGWGGRMGDIFAQSRNSQSTFTCINAAGNAVFLSGKQVAGYRVSKGGAIPIAALKTPLAGSYQCSALLRELVTDTTHFNLFQREYNKVVRDSINAEAFFSGSIQSVPTVLPRFAQTGGGFKNSLEAQLNMVARSIAASSQLGAKRQVFFVQMTGFDTHNRLLDEHPQLIEDVANAISKFYQTTEDLGVAHQVTTFTASDFGRSWGNDDGSDHGWGSMHFVVGGAVNGQRFFGSAPEIITGTPKVLRTGGPDDVGNGRLLPKTSVDQLAGTLGRWMGLSDNQTREVLPNLNNWKDDRYLKFLPI